MIFKGRVWLFGDNIDTDLIIPGKYLIITDPNELAKHLFENIIESFYTKIKPGDIIVAGRNFGCGSSREHAPRLLKIVGIGAVIAKSFAHIFYRNSINIGLPVIIAKVIPDITQNSDVIEVNLVEGYIKNITQGVVEHIQQYPKSIELILNAGGIVEYIKRYGEPPWQGNIR